MVFALKINDGLDNSYLFAFFPLTNILFNYIVVSGSPNCPVWQTFFLVSCVLFREVKKYCGAGCCYTDGERPEGRSAVFYLTKIQILNVVLEHYFRLVFCLYIYIYIVGF